ncbi:hypothetical protein [Halorubellus litoreus]|uniref:Short C-terminal domain-containing protein n=1 Tax=Halorubellus litoreus TaxID=755308 RepID=A0ABD5VFR6_9EURY
MNDDLLPLKLFLVGCTVLVVALGVLAPDLANGLTDVGPVAIVVGAAVVTFVVAKRRGDDDDGERSLAELRREYARGNVDEDEVDARLDELTDGDGGR